MSEWWTYSLSDLLLFSPRTYYRLLELYNADVWPLQVLALALGLALLVLLARGGAWSGEVIAAVLIAVWLWVAWAYLLLRYDSINWAARYCAAGFAVEAAMIAWIGLVGRRLRFPPAPKGTRRGGQLLLAFAVLIQPLLSPMAGRQWTQLELFGIAPDPSAVGTLGLVLAAESLHWPLLVIPLLWCVISAATLWTMGSPEAAVMLAVVVVALMLALTRRRARAAVPAARGDGAP
jgi:hypothetical protein